jgi:hypothetical protein
MIILSDVADVVLCVLPGAGKSLICPFGKATVGGEYAYFTSLAGPAGKPP